VCVCVCVCEGARPLWREVWVRKHLLSTRFFTTEIREPEFGQEVSLSE